MTKMEGLDGRDVHEGRTGGGRPCPFQTQLPSPPRSITTPMVDHMLPPPRPTISDHLRLELRLHAYAPATPFGRFIVYGVQRVRPFTFRFKSPKMQSSSACSRLYSGRHAGGGVGAVLFSTGFPAVANDA